jgi:hypothetical protein
MGTSEIDDWAFVPRPLFRVDFAERSAVAVLIPLLRSDVAGARALVEVRFVR